MQCALLTTPCQHVQNAERTSTRTTAVLQASTQHCCCPVCLRSTPCTAGPRYSPRITTSSVLGQTRVCRTAPAGNHSSRPSSAKAGGGRSAATALACLPPAGGQPAQLGPLLLLPLDMPSSMLTSHSWTPCPPCCSCWDLCWGLLGTAGGVGSIGEPVSAAQGAAGTISRGRLLKPLPELLLNRQRCTASCATAGAGDGGWAFWP
jgi:hypothetical protein